MRVPMYCKARRLFESTPQSRAASLTLKMESMLQDLRHAVRALRSNPAFTAIAVLTLALGIGVNAAIFSVVYAVLLRPLPYTQPAQLALISSAIEEPGASRTPLPGALFNEIRQRASLLSGIAGIIVTNARLDTAEAPELVRIARVSSNFFQLLGVQAVRGRTIASGEELRASNMVVLSNGFWRSRLGGDPNIAGKDVHLQGGGSSRSSARCRKASACTFLPIPAYSLKLSFSISTPISPAPRTISRPASSLA